MVSFTLFRAGVPLAALCLSLSAGSPLRAQGRNAGSTSGPVLNSAPASQSSPAPSDSGAAPINISVVVHDKHGALISNLDQSSFQLWIDKKPATIHSFGRNSNLPLTVGLIVDVDPGQRDALDEERKASAAFFDEVLSGSGSVFVAQYARQIDLLQDTTASKAKLQQALNQLATAGPGSDSADKTGSADPGGSNGGNTGNRSGWPGQPGRGSVPVVGRPRQPNTVLYDALFLSSDQLMGKTQGRKALIVVTDGADRGSKGAARLTPIEAAQRARTPSSMPSMSKTAVRANT